MNIDWSIPRPGSSVEATGRLSKIDNTFWLEPASMHAEHRGSTEPPSAMAVALERASEWVSEKDGDRTSQLVKVIGTWTGGAINVVQVEHSEPIPLPTLNDAPMESWEDSEIQVIFDYLLMHLTEWHIYMLGKGESPSGRPVIDAWVLYVHSDLASWVNSIPDGALRLRSWILPNGHGNQIVHSSGPRPIL